MAKIAAAYRRMWLISVYIRYHSMSWLWLTKKALTQKVGSANTAMLS